MTRLLVDTSVLIKWFHAEGGTELPSGRPTTDVTGRPRGLLLQSLRRPNRLASSTPGLPLLPDPMIPVSRSHDHPTRSSTTRPIRPFAFATSRIDPDVVMPYLRDASSTYAPV